MKPTPPFKNSPFLQVALCAFLLFASAAGAYFSLVTLYNHDQLRFQHAQKQVERVIEDRIETYINALLQTRSMFYVTREVDREEFARYVDHMELIEKYPGIQGIGFTKRLAPQEVRPHETEVRRQLPSYKVWPQDPRKEYFSIVYLEPLDWRNKRAVGYDMFTNPVRRQAMERARDTGLPAMSGPVELVQETEEDKQPGFLIYVPVYKTGAPTETPEQRKENLVGFVYSPFRAKDLFRQIMEPINDLAVDLEVIYSTPESSSILFDRYPEFSSKKGSFSSEQTLTFAQLPWIVRIHALPEFRNSSSIYLPLSIFVLGSILSLLITGFLVKKTRHAELMEEKSRYLEKLNLAARNLSSELNLQELVQNLTDVGTEFTGAQFGAFFYNTISEKGEALMLYTVSGVPIEEFSKFPMPRNTAVFAPTFGGETLLSEDITQDPRYGKNAPYKGIPKGHLPVRSYLSVAVVSRSGEVIGGLFFGHEDRGKFTDNEKQFIEGLAPQAAIAIDNARLYEEAKQAIATREEFLSIASHELRTPITSMKLQFQAAQRMILGKNMMVYQPVMVEKRINTAIRQLERMSKLIEDMLDSSRIALNKFQINLIPFDLCKILAETTERFKEQITISGVELSLDIPKNHPYIVYGDEYKIEQVISNLINNAIKYGEQKPIFISLSHENNHAIIKVEDSGVGIPKESLNNIFHRYERISSSANVGGLGLGLYISQKIIDEHKGRIEVESEPGVRTIFKVILPLGHNQGKEGDHGNQKKK